MEKISSDFVDREYIAPIVEYISNMTFKDAPADAAFDEIFESSYTFIFNYEDRTVKYTFVNKERLEIDGQVIYLTDEKEVMDAVKKFCKIFTVKSSACANGRTDLVDEIRTENNEELVKEIRSLSNVDSVSLLKHDGEVTY